ncbi:hypothetical protein [Delftia acidovorans]|uniref:hypothetical protein n=1 Tax=Delftia acidovorans TaxID=80866 RepID=UPI00192CC4B9|nr:hypothetical protein [Delftia acidovorans]
MMPTIKFEALADTALPLSRELLCTVWPLDSRSEESSGAEPIVESHPILVGSANPLPEESEVNLPTPGNYLVDLKFPNGRRTRRAVTVSVEEPYLFLVEESRYATSGPRNSLAQPASFFKEAPRVMLSAAKSIFTRSELEVRMSATQSPPGVGSLRALRGFLKDLEAESNDGVLIHRERAADLAHTMEIDSTPANVDSEFQSATHRRAWLLINGQGRDATVVPFPNGWTSGSGKGAYLLAVQRKATTGDEATKWSVSLQMRDPSYGSLLDYLTRRDFQGSSAVSQTLRTAALAALYKKQMNPYAAAAGAYMLAMTDEEAQAEQGHWMGNLTDRFPWLPDGPIAQGYRLLRRTEKGTSDFNQARFLMLKAVDRGLPYFTIGLTLLTEALGFISLASPDDVEAKRSHAAAMSAQIACVRSEAFCTLQTSRYYRLPQGPDDRA